MQNNLFKKVLFLSIIILFVVAGTIPKISGDPPDPGSEIATGTLEVWTGARKLARTSDGILHCFYHRSDGQHSQIYHSYSTDDGDTWTEEPITSEDYDQVSPCITVDSNDNLHVVWQGCHDNSPQYSQIRYRMHNGDWIQIEDITSDYNWDHRSPAIAVDGNNNLHVVFQKVDYIGGAWCQHGCGPAFYTNNIQGFWMEPEMIGEAQEYNDAVPSISIGPNNYLHVAWDAGGYHNGNCWHSAYRRYNNGFWEPIKFFPCYDNGPSIAVDDQGNAHHVVKYSYPLSGIKYRMRDNVAWVLEEIIQNTVPAYVSKYPSIALDSNEYIHVVWPDNGNIFYSKKTTDWSAIDPIISDTDSTSPHIIWSWHPEVNGVRTNIPKNGYAFVWNDGDIIKFYGSEDLEWEMLTGNQPPNPPSNPQPGNDETGVSLNPTLSVDVSDPDGDTLDVTFYDVTDGSIIGIDYDIPSGSTATTTWSGLYQGTTYFWCVIANDGIDNTQSSTWSFTTNQPPLASFNVNPLAGQITTIFGFDASSCSDNEDDTADLKIRWDWENDGIYDTDWTTNKMISHQYNPKSTYTVYEVKLAVKDTDDLVDFTTKEILVYFDDCDELDESTEWVVAEHYFPILFFDSDESCYPTNINYHLKNSDLKLFPLSGPIKNNPLTAEDIEKLTNTNQPYYMDNIHGGKEGIISHYEINRPQYGDVVYVHVNKSECNDITYTAIQYWFYYAFNDGQFPWPNHEGDWEMIQVLLDEQNNPIYVVRSWHNGKECKSWNNVDVVGDHPIIYVALGSHANYFSTEDYWIEEPWYEFFKDLVSRDQADGNGTKLDKDDFEIVVLGERNCHPYYQNWLDYAGFWGYYWGIESGGPPRGPMYRYDCESWDFPAQWALEDKIILKANCPVNLTIIDNDNRKIGFVDSEFVNEIPGASVDIFGDIEIYYLPTDLTYTYDVRGYDEGTYNLTIINEQANITVNVTDLPIFSNALHQYTINWSALTQGEEGVTIQIDADGDDIFEQTITSDCELTYEEFILQTYGLWVNNEQEEKAIEWSGSKTEINGDIHSNDGIKISGSKNNVNGIVYYVSQLDISGSNNNYDSAVQISPRPYPIYYDILDYQPGGEEAEKAQNDGRYHYIDDDFEVSDSKEELDGLYYVTGDAKLSGSKLSGTFTIVAEGKIEISGSKHNYESYSNDLIFFSNGDLFKLSGGKNSHTGITYVPYGEIEISGSKNTVTGGFFGDTIKLSGSKMTITAL